MEDNQENKAKFFAQYWGQNVLHNGNPIYGISLTAIEYGLADSHLVLKNLSSITDEDAVEVAELAGYDISDKSIITKEKILQLLEYRFMIVDALRSKGYALPYMG